MTYKVDSPEAEEFIHHEEILETLEYARTNKDNRALIEQLRIYSLDGRYLGSDIGRLGKGIYIINNRKVVISGR